MQGNKTKNGESSNHRLLFYYQKRNTDADFKQLKTKRTIYISMKIVLFQLTLLKFQHYDCMV